MKLASCLSVLFLGITSMACAVAQAPIILENDLFRIEVGLDAKCLALIDRATGENYLDAEKDAAFAQVRLTDRTVDATAATFDQNRLALSFGDSGIQAVLHVKIEPRYLTIEVIEVRGGAIEELIFANMPLTLKGALDEPFAACALALNLQTNIVEIPGPMPRLRAMCYTRFGIEGAKIAIIGSPLPELRDIMKDVVRSAEELPRTDIGGPFALDATINRGSYLFDFGSVTEDTVDKWIEFVKTLGLTQIDFHTGTSLRFGDYRPNPDLFPRGRDSVKAVIDKLHAAGLHAGLHTYAFFIDKNTPYVTPVPDPRLGKSATFTLASALSAGDNVVPVEESTEKMSTTTGFFVRNSVTLQIGDELITYSGVSKEAPYTFTGCTRGAYGTQAAAHDAGAKVHHLKECFGLFTPDADSTLLAEIAFNTADVYNECGFDMIYLDALDGSDILSGGENAWHYGSKFVFEIAQRLEKPALFEMSSFHHHLWYVRARMGAWDHPSRSHKRFIDVHAAANASGSGMFLPMNLGWWAVKTWQDGPNSTQVEATFPDDIEYLLGKALGNDMSISLMGVNPDNIGSIPAYQRLAPIFRQYEELRHAGYFSEAIKAQLREPGAEFTLLQDDAGDWRFRPVTYDKHKVAGLDGWSNQWTVNNRFEAQPVRLRIEALMAAAPYDDPKAYLLEDFSNFETLSDRTNAEGVSSMLDRVTDLVKTGSASGRFQAQNTRETGAGAWCKWGRSFDPTLNIKEQRGLGVWVHGDGSGALLNFQLLSPHYTTSAGIGDHYVPIDFTGWRYFELIEMEGARIEEYQWPYGGAYAVYRENVDHGLIDRFSIWYNNLPPGGETVCHIGPVKALPLLKTQLTNPVITVNGQRIALPVTIESGCYLELNGPDDCILYGPKGEVLEKITLTDPIPALAPGSNAITFTCDPPDIVQPRANVTVIAMGELL